MNLDTVIFDMDGLLIDSEPLWKQAAIEVFQQYDMSLNEKQYASTKGMRTSEFVEYWFFQFKLPVAGIPEAGDLILSRVVELVRAQGKAMPGVEHIFNFFRERNFRIGLATSSGKELIEVVVEQLGISPYLQAISSAASLRFGKPHPQVYLDCAEKLNALPAQCICFEDSLNGMIAAKAARMKCIVVPSADENQLPAWQIADLKISSLQNFNELLLQSL